MFKISKLVALALAVASLFGPAAFATEADDLRNLSVEQTQVYQLNIDTAPQADGLNVTAWVDHRDNVYGIGENVRLFVRTNKDAYITIFNVGPSGQVTLLFPNAYQIDNRIKGGATLEVPGPGTGAEIKVQPPVGTELIKVIASTKPIEVVYERDLTGSGVFKSIAGGTTTIARNLGVVAADVGQGHEIDSYNKVIRSVKRGAAAPVEPAEIVAAGPPAAPEGGVTVFVGAGPAVPGDTESDFPLLLAVDRAHYAIGDTVTMSVTALEDCHLTVINLTAEGRARVLFPNAAQRENLLKQRQTLILSGVAEPVQIKPLGPPGRETVVALCSTSKEPIIAFTLDASEVFTVLGSAEQAVRDLTAVVDAPVGQMAFAEVSFSVEAE